MDLDTIYTYHPPQPGQPEKYQAIREKAKDLARLLLESCPTSRERSTALTKLEECTFWANASIARHEPECPKRARLKAIAAALK